MKKILSLLICIIIFLSFIPAGLADEVNSLLQTLPRLTVAPVTQQINNAGGGAVNELNISNVQVLTPSNNEEINTVAGQHGYRVQAQITNNSNETTDGLVIVQVRHGTGATVEEGGKVLDCVGVSSGIPVTGSTVTSDFVLPSGLSGTAYVDVYAWNGWDAQVPLAAPNHSMSFTVNP
ncbi:hypothetical protein Dtox_3491 [Desulfofarcimen acetoxidans DSM 771]|uniref:Uncharacterized protein n=1 Tax=Desulfofarcimen acetoxidans (strain ATCC 49208 / DSM 771 / KCTC 5769 / VKM B-1644 / 5575) TaxID=485916 RepID=C8W6V1_DESAS|nr:hypothetical protein [Desulfofarcimen acetoxidans]ACV64210.1 hypothetical protein Dtox_3491 [Desulfofarcimen acetoxidans DSM 771]